MSLVQQMALEALAARCARETERYHRDLDSDPNYCLELFRRAVVERQESAWTLIFKQYESLVEGWARRHSAYEASGEEAGYFVNRAFEKLMVTMTAEKFGRQVTTLGGLLSYLKMCVSSVILDHLRAARKVETMADEQMAHLPGEPSPEGGVTEALMAVELWYQITRLANDDKELKVLRASFVLDMKARDIFEAYPDDFANLNEVYRTKERFLKRLRRNESLARFVR